MRKLISLLLFAFCAIAYAQQMPQMPKLPTDPKTRIGKLDNGLTYYVRHNEYPEHVANFYIAQRVGSIQENDDQRGLAHFLEHMAFNGSNHFPGNGIIDFTRSLGVAFGNDLNAYTSIEQTVYNIDNVPTTRQSALDSCLVVLQDWSNGLLLQSEEIDKERGVIHGEWSMRNSAQQRLFERSLPLMYPGCKYGERLPIGTMEVVDNFAPEALRAYYRKWYHPENQAIIVIGDIDVDHTEAMIKQLFSDIKAGPEAAHVVPLMVPDNDEAIYVFDKDKEMQYTMASIMLKTEAMPREMKGTQMEYVQSYLTSMISQMFNSRMSELSQDPDCPFVQLSMSYGSYLVSSTVDNFEVTVVAKEGKEREAYAAMVRELKRVKDFGFTGSEFVRAKEELLSRVEKAYANRDKRKNTEYYQECVNNYLEGSAMPDADLDYQLFTAIAQQLPLEVINQTAQQAITIDQDKNLVSYCFTQEKDGAKYLTADDMKAVVAAGRAEALTAWVDNTKNEPLIAEMPKAGTIVKETKNEKLGATELQLSNGAKVVIRKTDFKDNEIVLNGFAAGGKGLYGAADYSNLKAFDNIANTFGLGNFTNNELEKALAGKQCGISLSLGNHFNTVSGSTTPKDVETMFQLLYLSFTAPQKDEKAYGTLMQQFETMLKNRDLQPETQLSDSIHSVLYKHNPRFAAITVADLPNISLDRCMQIARERFSNVNNFTFNIVGNFDEAQLRQLICQYVASLPGKEKAVKTPECRTYFDGKVNCEFSRKMETPKPNVFQLYRANVDYTLENNILMDFASEVLSMVLLKSVREDAGATYSIGASGAVNSYNGNNNAIIQIYCPISSPEKLDLALELIDKGVAEVAAKADADMVAKVKANLLKNADVNAKQNGYWLNVFEEYEMNALDAYTDYKKIVEAVTPEQVAAFLKKVVAGNKAQIVMRAE